MGLNKLENFIKNIEGRILYVNPNDLDATDSIENQGNSLAQPFKTIQRALLEAARFSYLRGSDNDIVEKTSILLFPGNHIVDNRPGFAIKKDSSNPLQAKAVAPGGAPESIASDTLTLNLDSNFDLTQSDNILYKFNSIYGGVVVPRGTSLVGLDLRKTKIRPKYVPNPTDVNVAGSSIFKVTGSCYFWQFSIFDGDETGLVYTDDSDFSSNNQSKPSFSHNKLTCFDYADGINLPTNYDLTDLDMYYSKLSNAFNNASGRDIDEKYPTNTLGFSKQRPEWEIVGAFATDPVNISDIKAGDGFSPSSIVTVTTSTPHGFNAQTPIKIKGVATLDYNVSTVVQTVTSDTTFTYLLPFVRTNLPANPSSASATVTIETDTVAGASPYIFNCSMRSVWGMNGLNADGNKASGFKSMVVAQFTGVSLQKDDRAFVKYNPDSRLYNGIAQVLAKGAALNRDASSTDPETVYHLDSKAIYRSGWETSHIKIQNDAVLQIVSVFAIGFNKHFDIQSGADASITNSNSNFGQISLSAEGFKKEAFDKDNNAYITNIITPKSITATEEQIEWLPIDVVKTKAVGVSSHLYIDAYEDQDDAPPTLMQGYRVGANLNETLTLSIGAGSTTFFSAPIVLTDNVNSGLTTVSTGTKVSEKSYRVTAGPSNSIFTIGNNELLTGEKVRIISDDGDLPENINANQVYYAIDQGDNNTIKIASTRTDAENGTAIAVNDGTNLFIISRSSDKESGDLGHAIQWDDNQNQWYIHSTVSNPIFPACVAFTGTETATNTGYIKRVNDPRSLDDKLYKLRVVVPKEAINAKDPTEGFVIQESSTTGFRKTADATTPTITVDDHDFNKNLRFIRTASETGNVATILTELPHDLNVGDTVLIKKVKSSNNTTSVYNKGYNGTFVVTEVTNDKQFKYNCSTNPGTFQNDTTSRDIDLPRFERNDCQTNFYIYRTEILSEYIEGIQDGIYHVFGLKSDKVVPSEFTKLKYSQNVEDLYPQLDKDNYDDNPSSAKSFGRRTPLGDVVTNDLKKSITRENADSFLTDFGLANTISGISTTTTRATFTFDRAHRYAGIIAGTVTGGASYTSGTYQNVPLLTGSQSGTWGGATARVVVTGGGVSSVDIICPGSGYGTGELFFDQNVIGNGNGNARFTVTEVNNNIGDSIQITGIGTVTDGITSITSVISSTQIEVARTNDDLFLLGQYALNAGPSVAVASTSYTALTKITTFNCPTAHGLVSGNKFRVLDVNNASLGDFVVKEKVGINTFTSITSGLTGGASRLIKQGLTAANANSDNDNESLGARGLSFYKDGINLVLGADLGGGPSDVNLQVVGINTLSKAPLGSHIQIDNEILKVTTSTISGTNNNTIVVNRGVLGSSRAAHKSGALIQRIYPLAVEFRRPSIIRASGHTFEYLGYGQGNYSTGLPQVQNRTLTDREDFLAQSQERSCGQVVYTGMNSDGDFFIGNKRVSSSTGKERTFDAPIPTVTGQDPSRLSVVFDEVTIKDRLTVEGGKSKRILSQFDGPVTINNDVKIGGGCVVEGKLRAADLELINDTQSVNKDTGSLVVQGGLGVEKHVNIGGGLGVGIGTTAVANGMLNVDGAVDFNSTLNVDGNTTLGGTLNAKGNVDFDTDLNVDGNQQLDGTLNVDGATTLTDTLDVDGATTLKDALNVDGNATFQNNITLNGDAKKFTIENNGGTDKFVVHSSNGNVEVSGISTHSGNILPSADDTHSLGQGSGPQLRWKNVYAVNFHGRMNGSGESVDTVGTSNNSTDFFIPFVANSGSTTGETLRVNPNIYFRPHGTASSADLTVRGDITAFGSAASDDRLKTNKVGITSALAKVGTLSGFTYNWNSLAGTIGFSTDVRQVGVSAQQVQAVVPEAVQARVIGPANNVGVSTEFLIVKYEKLAPLLIEAIKELKAENDALKARVTTLESS